MFWRRRSAEDFAEEIKAHLELEAEDLKREGLSEDEAVSLMSIAVDFGVTQVVDGNWGVHAIIKKSLFVGEGG